MDHYLSSRAAVDAAPRFVQMAVPPGRSPEVELADGLMQQPSRIDPKFLYDELGSHLFTAITQLPEYYPTRCEAEIFARHGAEFAEAAGIMHTLVDLGAGDCSKGERLLQHVDVDQYVPVDISADYLREAATRVASARPGLDVVALGLDFCEPLALPAEVADERRLFMYAGSSIGNLAPERAQAMLANIRSACAGGGLLVGVDRVKPREVLEPAYDDALGVTAAFNLNVLRHANALLGSDFQVADWRHVSRYDEGRSRIEMHLEARRQVTVRWPGGERSYAAGERIHTENSYKYTAEAFIALLTAAGFEQISHWSDSQDWFSVFLAHA